LGDACQMATGEPMTLLEREQEALAAAPSHDELVMRLRVVVKEELASGATHTEVLAALDDLRAHDPEREDVVLDVMDFVVGWSSPHVSLRGSGAWGQARDHDDGKQESGTGRQR